MEYSNMVPYVCQSKIHGFGYTNPLYEIAKKEILK